MTGLMDVKVAGLLAALAAAALGLNVSGILESIVLLGAALAAFSVIWQRGVRPGFRFCRKAAEGVEILLKIESWQHAHDRRLRIIEARLEPLESLNRRQELRRQADDDALPPAP